MKLDNFIKNAEGCIGVIKISHSQRAMFAVSEQNIGNENRKYRFFKFIINRNVS